MDNPVQLKSQGHVHKSNVVRWLAGSLIALFLIAPVAIYAWRYLYNPCEVEAVKEASAILDIEMQTGMGGDVFSGFKRMFTGESFFITTFMNNDQRKRHVAFAAPYPGKIV